MNNLPTEFWHQVMDKLESRIQYTTFQTFFKKMTLAAVQDTLYIVAVNDEMSMALLPTIHIATMEEIISDLRGQQCHVKLINRAEDIDSLDLPQMPMPTINNKMENDNYSLLEQYRINPQNTFDNFVVGKSNQFAHAASLSIAEAMAQDLACTKNYNPLFIYGGSGLGKTHLMHAIAQHIISINEKAKIIYVSSETFTNEMIDAIRDNQTTRFRSKYRQVDLLLIDDIQFLANKEGTQEEFFHTFNDLYQANRQIIISSDRPPKEIPTLEERLRTRFEWGLITDIQSPDLETRIAILRKKAQMDNKIVDDDVTMFMAEHMETNIRELEGALLSLTTYATMNNLPLNIDLAKDFLSTYVNLNEPRQITPQLIQERICDMYAVTAQDLISKSRKQHIVFPRQLAMYLCRELTEATLVDIGDIFGNRDHSTVSHGIEKIENLIKKDHLIKATVQNLTKELKGE